MQVINIIEHKDGSATIEFDITAEEQKLLIKYALKDILMKEAKRVIEESHLPKAKSHGPES